jgi:hypothetical protein
MWLYGIKPIRYFWLALKGGTLERGMLERWNVERWNVERWNVERYFFTFSCYLSIF